MSSPIKVKVVSPGQPLPIEKKGKRWGNKEIKGKRG